MEAVPRRLRVWEDGQSEQGEGGGRGTNRSARPPHFSLAQVYSIKEGVRVPFIIWR